MRKGVKIVKHNIHNYDAFVKMFNVASKQFMFDDCVLGLFAIKCKYLKHFNYIFDNSPECEFANHVRQHVDPNRLMEITQLDLECCFAIELNMLTV